MRVEEPVPPLATGKIPVTLAVKSMVELVMSELTMREEDSRPELELWTTPAELKAVIVGAWETVSLAMVEVLVTVKLAIVEVANCEMPMTLRLLFNVAAPITPKVPEIVAVANDEILLAVNGPLIVVVATVKIPLTPALPIILVTPKVVLPLTVKAALSVIPLVNVPIPLTVKLSLNLALPLTSKIELEVVT